MMNMTHTSMLLLGTGFFLLIVTLVWMSYRALKSNTSFDSETDQFQNEPIYKGYATHTRGKVIPAFKKR